MNLKLLKWSVALSGTLFFTACSNKDAGKDDKKSPEFEIVAEEFADLQILRYQVKDFEKLSPSQKELAYYLYEAALSGRDIIYDQKYKHNLAIRKTLEAILENYSGDKKSKDWENFVIYAKRVFFSNGIHHHYSNIKFIPEHSAEYFASLVKSIDSKHLPLNNKSIDEFINFYTPIIFDPELDKVLVNQEKGNDPIASSANNFYSGLTKAEVDNFYSAIAKEYGDSDKPEIGLNGQLVKENGIITERLWKSGGMYGAAIDKMIFWLEKALTVAENEAQKNALSNLINYYKSGNVEDWDKYNISWIQDTASVIDFASGFIEVYGDAIGRKGSFESVLSMKDFEASKRINAISAEAQWFEDNSPILPEHKKEKVKGIIAKVITVVVESGDAAPSTPIGINLPNNNWVREKHGSKSVSLGNIVHAYNEAKAKSSASDEFAFNKEIADRIKKYGNLAGELHTDMHEVIGHASGKINKGVAGPEVTLATYASTLEEARADLVALYFIMDQKLIDLKLMPSLDVAKAEYDSYIMNGLISQLTRLKRGENLAEAHMRNRQLVAKWAFEKGKADNVIEMVQKDGKTYVKINDYDKLRKLFGDLLREIQRIKSEGDYNAGMALVEDYGTIVDQKLLDEVLTRYEKLQIKPYSGFIQPRLVPVEKDGKIVDVKVEYPEDFMQQMLEFGKKYSFLPIYN